MGILLSTLLSYFGDKEARFYAHLAKELLQGANVGSMLDPPHSKQLECLSQARVLVLGLDNAGKTTILYRLHAGEVVRTVPTIGFNVETVQYKNVKFQVWDLGGQTSIRPYWRCYYPNTQAIIFVVDSSDAERLDTACQEFHAILSEEELSRAAVVVFANKQDVPDALPDSQIAEALKLDSIKDRQWAIFRTSAVKGQGIWEGMEWLVRAVKSSRG